MSTRRKNTGSLLDDDVFDIAGSVLKVLGHPNRLRIVNLLMQEELAVGDLAERLGLAPNAVSQHLTHMTDRGICRRHRRGQRVYYEVVHVMARNLMQCMWRNMGSS